MNLSDKYIFLQNSDELVSDLQNRYTRVNQFLNSDGIRARWNKSLRAYYGFYYNDTKSKYGMGTAGQQEELSTVVVNDYRNIIQHTLALTTQNKVSFDPVAFNTGTDGRNASIVANATLEYFFEQPPVSREIYNTFESAVNLGTTFLFTLWDRNKVFRGIDGEGKAIYSGTPKFKLFMPFDVLLEPFKTVFEEQNWINTRELVNRFELVAEHPEFEKEILALPRVQDIQLVDPYFLMDEDHIWLYKFYHKATRGVPFGRYMEYAASNAIFIDTFDNGEPNPYCTEDRETKMPIVGTGMPVVCYRPAVTQGLAWGHTVGFDLLPLQDLKNMTMATIASNQAAFGVQNIVTNKGSNFNAADITQGLRNIEVAMSPDLPNGGIPMVLKLLDTPSELFKTLDVTDQSMEKASGINGAMRGTPPSQVSSGTAMALLTTQAQTFNTPLENVYVSCLQETAMNLLNILAKFMPDHDLVQIVGLQDKYAIPSFKASQLSLIKEIKVLTGNAMSKAPAGRVAMADQLANSNKISSAEYFEIIQTGTIKQQLNAKTMESALVVRENQMMLQGMAPPVRPTDNHILHMEEHFSLCSNPTVRDNDQLYQMVYQHIMEHDQQMTVLEKINPQMLALITHSPIPPGIPEPGLVPGGPPPTGPQEGVHQPQHGGSPGPAHPTTPSSPGGAGVNNVANASTPGGVASIAASGIRSAGKLLTHGRK